MVQIKRIKIFTIFLLVAFLPLIYATIETDWLIQEYNKRDRTIEETALTLLAINKQSGSASSIPSTTSKLKSYLDSCIQANNCNNKEVALAIWALKESKDNSPTLDAATNWLINSRTIFAPDTDADDWLVQVISSSSGRCAVNNTETKTEMLIDVSSGYTPWQSARGLVTENTNDLVIDCSALTRVDSISLIKKKTISSIVNYFIIEEIQNKKSTTVQLGIPCWGSTYRSSCDRDTTAYALLVLNKLGKNPDPAWLEQQSSTAFENAVLYLMTNKPTYISALQSSQSQSGFWQPVDIATTSLVYSFLPAQSEPAKKAFGWLQGQRAEEGCWPKPSNLCNIKSTAAAVYAIGTTTSNATSQPPPVNATTPPSNRTTLEDCDEPCLDKDGCVCLVNECKRSIIEEDETCEGPKSTPSPTTTGTYCVTEGLCDGQTDRLGRCIDIPRDGCPEEDDDRRGSNGTGGRTDAGRDTGTSDDETGTGTLFWVLMITAALIALVGGSIWAYKKGLIKFKKKPMQEYKPRMKPTAESKPVQEYQPRIRVERKQHPVKKFLDNELDKSIEELEKLLKS